MYELDSSFSRSITLLRVAAKLDLGLDHLRLVCAADLSFKVSNEVVLLQELVVAILTLVWYEVCIMYLNMLLHVVELGELLAAS